MNRTDLYSIVKSLAAVRRHLLYVEERGWSDETVGKLLAAEAALAGLALESAKAKGVVAV
jgi:hypothetical protein